MKICIVTPDLLGPVRNGGIGTANTNLAMFFAQEGHDVNVLFSQVGTPARGSDAWCARYRELGIAVDIIEEWRRERLREVVYPQHPHLHMAYDVFNWLASGNWDLIVLTEWQGHGFYALQAKRTGVAFSGTTFVTQIHSPSIWHSTNNGELTKDPLQAITYFIERKSVELTDVVISPSRYMLDWVRRHDFRPPRHARVIPNLITLPTHRSEPLVDGRARIDELVFFGRLEYRKGLKQFCDALDRLIKSGHHPRQVTFLGKYARIENHHAALYLAQRSANWGFAVKILSRKNQAEAIAYLQSGSRLAVMPSVADNSPYTVYECLTASIPFAARNVGGVSELIADEFHAHCLFNDNPQQLCDILVQALTKGAICPRLAFSPDSVREKWRDVLIDRPTSADMAAGKVQPKVSVCLVHYNRPALLKQAVQSLIAQDYPNFEVILADDGSNLVEAQALLTELAPDFTKRGWQILRLENGYLGRARNCAAALASGDYLLFMDDDNFAKPEMISLFVRSACHSGAELISTVFDVFSGQSSPTPKTRVTERFLPIGDSVAFSVIANAIGDANSLISKSLFERLGGFSEDYGVGHEDFELYLRAVLQGIPVAVCPLSLFWYRRNDSSMLSTTSQLANRLRSFRPFMEMLPAAHAELALMSLGLTDAPAPVRHGISPYLTVAERRAVEEGDPDAPETIVAVAKALLEQDAPDMAVSLLAELDGENAVTYADSYTVATLQKKFLDAIRDGNTTHVLALVAEVDSSTLDSVLKAVSMRAFGRMVRKLVMPPSVLIELAADSVAKYAITEDIASWKISAELYLAAGEIEKAAIAFQNWLACSDRTYLSHRNDVAFAVQTGTFSSGLQHYHLHGRHENAVWPARDEQRFFIVELAKQLHTRSFVIPPDSALNQLGLALTALLPEN